MRVWRIGALAAAAMLSVSVLAACTSNGGIESGNNQGFVSADTGLEVIPRDDREAAPAVTGTTLGGEDMSLADFAGDVVVMNLWASWCGPCRGEAPALQEVYQTSRKKGVQFLGINTRDQDSAARAFEDGFGITYPSLVDTSGEIQLTLRDFLPPFTPSSVVIDREGRVAARIVGPTTYNELSGLVDDIASEK